MTEPTPWKESGDEVGRLLKAEAEADHWSARSEARVWAGIEGRIAARSPFWTRGRVLTACSVIALSLAFISVLRYLAPGRKNSVEATLWQRVPDYARDDVEIVPGTEYRVGKNDSSKELEVFVQRGHLRARVAHRPPGQRFVVSTPHLRVIVVGTRFQVEVADQRSQVTVSEGLVTVKGRNREVSVQAGHSIASDDPRFAQVVESNQLPVSECQQRTSLLDRRECYRNQIQESGLQTETALLSLALIERYEMHSASNAMKYLRRHRQRFPQGALAPEVSLNLLQTLAEARQCNQAFAEIDHVRKEFPELTPLQDEALFYEALCQGLKGRTHRANALFDQYRDRFPRGRHIQELPTALR